MLRLSYCNPHKRLDQAIILIQLLFLFIYGVYANLNEETGRRKDSGGGQEERQLRIGAWKDKKADLWEKIWDLEMEQEGTRAEGEEAHKENDSFRN